MGLFSSCESESPDPHCPSWPPKTPWTTSPRTSLAHPPSTWSPRTTVGRCWEAAWTKPGPQLLCFLPAPGSPPRPIQQEKAGHGCPGNPSFSGRRGREGGRAGPVAVETSVRAGRGRVASTAALSCRSNAVGGKQAARLPALRPRSPSIAAAKGSGAAGAWPTPSTHPTGPRPRKRRVPKARTPPKLLPARLPVGEPLSAGRAVLERARMRAWLKGRRFWPAEWAPAGGLKPEV